MNYIWSIDELKTIEPNGRKVISTFSCGGGSSMGYKLRGYKVLRNVEIDPRVNKVYNRNLHPDYSFEMDIREFVKKEDLPEEFYDIDILDGSPPCSTFSMIGKREDGWGKAKKFREGQKLQTLDDLFFEFIKLTKKLQPKVFVAENVKGLILANRRGYVNQILKGFDEAGYTVQLFLLDASKMGVPQRRERVFFVGHRKDLDFPKLKLNFNMKPILYGDYADKDFGRLEPLELKLWKSRRVGDMDLSDTYFRVLGRKSSFGKKYVYLNQTPGTQTTTHMVRFDKPGIMSARDVLITASFPVDYDLLDQQAEYICGMSVPPLMMEKVALAIEEQWFKHGKGKVEKENS